MTTTLESSHDIRCRLSAQSVDADLGLIRGCTVMKADVQATGKFVMLDAKGVITFDDEQCKKRIPVFTDAKTLDTLMAAAKVVGERIKMREDHDDSVGARAGYASDFKRITDADGDRVATDLHVFNSYRNRAVMLETAKETPREIGLSIDFEPTFEIVGEKALMRVRTLNAVDVVDEGAVTPDGLFLSARVDKPRKSEIENIPVTKTTMAAETSPNADILAAITAMGKTICDSLASLAAAKPAAAAPDAKVEEALSAIRAENVKLAAEVKKVTDQATASRKERALLGLSPNERTALAASPVEDIEKAAAGKKDYLTLVNEHVAATKCKKSEAHQFVMKAHSAEYRAHLNSRGISPGAKAA